MYMPGNDLLSVCSGMRGYESSWPSTTESFPDLYFSISSSNKGTIYITDDMSRGITERKTGGKHRFLMYKASSTENM